jgi:hypothetical protein
MKRIAMKCTQKEFNIIRPTLIDNGFNVSACYCFESFPYLINDYNGKFYIGTQGPNSIEMKNRIIHEVWNADIFLQYCNIETKFILPTLWKVKDCKEVTDYARNRFSKGMNNTVRPNDFLCVDEDIPTYWFLRENIDSRFNDFTEITLEQFKQYVIKEKVQNKQTMKQKLTVPASDITKLYNVACVPWMKIIAGYLAEVNSNREITFTQADIDKMFKVATSGQLLVLEEIFGKQQEVIDYNKLKAGSVVMLEFTGRIFGSKKDAEKVNFNEPFTIVFYNTSYYINSSNIYRDKSEYYDKIITFNQVNNGIGQFIAYSASDMNYIVKVISY